SGLPVMAAVKMAGLDVTPSRPSSLTILARSPEVMRPRRMLSYQMLCPYFWTSITRFMVTPQMVRPYERSPPGRAAVADGSPALGRVPWRDRDSIRESGEDLIEPSSFQRMQFRNA